MDVLIEIQSDKPNDSTKLTYDTSSRDGFAYRITKTIKGSGNMAQQIVMPFTEAELRELHVMISNCLEYANKQDW